MYLYFIYFYKLINKIVINQVISYWPSYGSEVCCIGPRPTSPRSAELARSRRPQANQQTSDPWLGQYEITWLITLYYWSTSTFALLAAKWKVVEFQSNVKQCIRMGIAMKNLI